MALLLPSRLDPFHPRWGSCLAEWPEPYEPLPDEPTALSRRPLIGAAVLAPRASMAFELLVAKVDRAFPERIAEALVEHVVSAYLGDGYDVQRAAAEELIARDKQIREREIRVASRPPKGSPFGVYRTRDRGGVLPWETWLIAWAPLEASCNCPDYLESSLGACVHVLAAMDDVESSKARRGRVTRAPVVAPVIGWDPVRPLDGTDPTWARLRAEATPATRILLGWSDDGTGALRPTTAEEAASADEYARQRPVHVTPAARAVIARTAQALEAARARSSSESEVLAELETLRRPLYPYQREGVVRFVRAGRLLLADDMGLGKTAQGIASCHALARAGKVRRGLVVVPAPLKHQWAREWRTFSSVPVHVVEGQPATRRALYEETSGSGFLIVNYELLLRDVDALSTWAPDVVVLDEAQRIKNAETKTAQAVKRIDAVYRLALSGTPLENRLDELASIMEWVDAEVLAPRWRLGPAHGGVRQGGVRGLSTVRARLAPRLVRRRRSEILAELPSRTDTTVPVEITPSQLLAHERLSPRIAELVSLAKQRTLSPAERLMLISLLTKQRVIANGMAQLEFESVWPRIASRPPRPDLLAQLFAPKLIEMQRIIEAFVIEQERKVVVFSQWRRMIRLVAWATRDILRDAGLRSVFFTGKESLRQRDRSIVDIHDDPWTRVLFATDCAGVGLNLQRAATVCVHVELPWNPAIFEQRVARLHRLGQTQPIDVVSLVTLGSIESRIATVVGAKQAVFDGLFDSDVDSILFEDRSEDWVVAENEDEEEKEAAA